MVVDFTKLTNPISKAFDSDFMDIYRNVDLSPERELLYENVPCHIAIKTTDNADPNSVDVQPIITSLAIHCNTYVDIKNNDYIVVKKTDTKGNPLHYYSGIIGEPAVSMARQSVNMQMSSLQESETPPTPPPAEEGVTVTISYLKEDNTKLREDLEQKVAIGSKITVKPLVFDNYKVYRIVVNGDDINLTNEVVIEQAEDTDYSIEFYYEEVVNIISIRPLVNGYYTMDNGNVKNGYHLYSEIPVLEVIDENRIKLASDKFYHDEIGTIALSNKLTNSSVNKFRDNLENWHIIVANPAKVEDGYIITYQNTEPVDCYVTHWYD